MIKRNSIVFACNEAEVPSPPTKDRAHRSLAPGAHQAVNQKPGSQRLSENVGPPRLN